MARLVRKIDLGDPVRTSPQDLLWKILKDGTGHPIRRGDANTLTQIYSVAPGSKALLDVGTLIIDEASVVTNHDCMEFDAGTAIREINGTISYHDINLIVEA